MKSIFLLWLYIVQYISAHVPAIDYDYVNSFINNEICIEQLNLLKSTGRGIIFRELSAYITPDTFRRDTIESLGSYSQCLLTKETIENHQIEGKYCRLYVEVPKLYIKDELFTKDVNLLDNTTVADLYENLQRMDNFCSRKIVPLNNPSYLFQISLGVCLPKTCLSKEAIKDILSNFGESNEWSEVLKPNLGIDIEYQYASCRLPNDKPTSVADYIAMGFFAVIFVLVVASTTYDLKMKHSEQSKVVFRSFSVYTNSKHLVTIDKTRKSVECVDGIRALAMLWIIILHVFLQRTTNIGNLRVSYLEYSIASQYLSVATFFLLSGTFVVYTNINQFKKGNMIKTLPMFYLKRLMRLLPILLVMMLIQASILNHISDGPLWDYQFAPYVNDCRKNWLSSLFFVENLIMCEDTERCLPHAWYVDADTQLYFISPLVLYWLLKSRRTAFTALTVVIAMTLVIAFLISYYFNLTPFGYYLARTYYYKTYLLKMDYMNPFNKTSFFIGMLCGYILNALEGWDLKPYKKTKYTAWILSMILLSLSIFCKYFVYDPNLNKLTGFIYNTVREGIWAVAVGWIVIASHFGCGGAIGWFLSLKLWKLPSKLSYGMYLAHYPIISLLRASPSEAQIHTVGSQFYLFLVVTAISMVVAFILSVTVEMPILNLYNIIVGNHNVKKNTEAADNE